MLPVHPLQQARCRVPLRCDRLVGSLRVQLYGEDLPALREPLGTWEFASGIEALEELEINLWRVDVHSMRVITSTGSRIARQFRQAVDSRISDRMRVEVALQLDGNQCLYRARLTQSAEEARALDQRLRAAEIPNIEWFFVELTNRCNLACPWCPSAGLMKRPRGFMPLERACELWRQIARYRQAHTRFERYAEIKNQIFLHVMGEPTLHPNFFEIIEAGQREGLDFCLITNASTLNRASIERLLDLRIKAVVVSLNVSNANAYRILHSPVPYAQLISGVQELISARCERKASIPRIEIQLLSAGPVVPLAARVLDTQDQGVVEAEIASWARYVAEQEIRTGTMSSCLAGETSLSGLMPEEGELDVRHEIGQNISVVVKRICNFANALLPRGATVHEAVEGYCPGQNPSRILCVLWDGACTFCSLDYDGELALGNVFERGIDAIWSDPRLRRTRRLMERGIAVEPLCRRCFGVTKSAMPGQSTAQERTTR